MNENHMKTSVTTGEVSLRWAKKADQRAKSSENGPISPNCYLLGLRRRLDYGPRRQKYHENAGNNHLKTVNIRSNGKSRVDIARVKIRYHRAAPADTRRKIRHQGFLGVGARIHGGISAKKKCGQTRLGGWERSTVRYIRKSGCRINHRARRLGTSGSFYRGRRGICVLSGDRKGRETSQSQNYN